MYNFEKKTNIGIKELGIEKAKLQAAFEKVNESIKEKSKNLN